MKEHPFLRPNRPVIIRDESGLGLEAAIRHKLSMLDAAGDTRRVVRFDLYGAAVEITRDELVVNAVATMAPVADAIPVAISLDAKPVALYVAGDAIRLGDPPSFMRKTVSAAVRNAIASKDSLATSGWNPFWVSGGACDYYTVGVIGGRAAVYSSAAPSTAMSDVSGSAVYELLGLVPDANGVLAVTSRVSSTDPNKYLYSAHSLSSSISTPAWTSEVEDRGVANLCNTMLGQAVGTLWQSTAPVPVSISGSARFVWSQRDVSTGAERTQAYTTGPSVVAPNYVKRTLKEAVCSAQSASVRELDQVVYGAGGSGGVAKFPTQWQKPWPPTPGQVWQGDFCAWTVDATASGVGVSASSHAEGNQVGLGDMVAVSFDPGADRDLVSGLSNPLGEKADGVNNALVSPDKCAALMTEAGYRVVTEGYNLAGVCSDPFSMIGLPSRGVVVVDISSRTSCSFGRLGAAARLVLTSGALAYGGNISVSASFVGGKAYLVVSGVFVFPEKFYGAWVVDMASSKTYKVPGSSFSVLHGVYQRST